MLLRSDRRYRFPLRPEELWTRIDQVEEFANWWPWLHRFDGQRLVAGEVWQCTVRPPVPYAVRFTVQIDEVLANTSVAATISGDVVGTARLDIEPTREGCETRLVAALGPDKQALRALSVAARPLVRFGHNWVLDTAARQFQEHNLPGATGSEQA